MSSSGKFDAKQVVSTAIALESQGRAHYLKAAEAVDDASVKAVFERLAAQEQAHQEYLENVLRIFQEVRHWPQEADLPQVLLDTARENLFPSVESAKPGSYSSVEDAIRRGIQLETDAIAFYKGAAGAATDQAARNMFNNLAIWEEEHLFILNFWMGRLNR